MPPEGALYLFLLGLASGITLLTISAYRRVSPGWVKWLLIACGALMISRYGAMASFASAETPEQAWGARHCWLASYLGLTLPSVFAIDQLLRHPAMTPKKLLGWFSPFLLAYGALILAADASPAPDPVMGWMPKLSPGWRLFASSVQGVYVLGFVGIGLMLIRKVPLPAIRTALLGLILAHLALGLDGLLLALGAWYFRPFLYSEMLTLFALWHAYQTAAAQ